MPRRLAVVDMGSNTLKFSVTQRDENGSERILHSHAETVRLGAGVATTGRIDEHRIERAMLALRHYELIAMSFGVEACIGVATAALRMARNGDDLLEQIHRTTSWKVSVITGAEEARLAFQGIVGELPPNATVLLVDIGGGSTELMHVARRELVASESLDLGSGTLADRCFDKDPPGRAALANAVRDADAVLTGSLVVQGVSRPEIVLSGGNGQFLKSFASWAEIDIPFTPQHVPDLLAAIAGIPASRLADYLAIVPERARMLPAGAAIAAAVIDRANPASIQAAPSGIRGGLVTDWIAQHP